MAGIPTAVVTRDGFLEVVQNAFAGYGFPGEAPVTYIFPTEMFVTDSDLTPLEEHFDDFIVALTEWAPENSDQGLTEPEMVEVVGDSYDAAVTTLNNKFLRNMWSDDLPIVPPTKERVDWILTGTDLDPDEVLSGDTGILPRGGIATVRMVAVSLAMAGGRPEYLPFLIAAVKLMSNPDAAMQNWNATTNSVVPAFVLDGPVAKEVRIGSGYGLLGPDPVHPAGQVLGRAVRLIQQDLGGAVPGQGTMAIFGGMRATNAFFAEDVDNIPNGWTSWAEDRGFTRDQNVLSLTIINSMCNAVWDFGEADTNDASLRMMASIMAYPDTNRFTRPERVSVDNMNMDTGIVLLPAAFAQSLVDANGYSKEDVKKFLWDNSKVDFSQIIGWGWAKEVTKNEMYKDVQAGDMIPVCPVPEQVTIVVAGGDQGGHGYYMAPVPQGNVVSVEIELPSNWDELLKKAESDLGPIPGTDTEE